MDILFLVFMLLLSLYGKASITILDGYAFDEAIIAQLNDFCDNGLDIHD